MNKITTIKPYNKDQFMQLFLLNWASCQQGSMSETQVSDAAHAAAQAYDEIKELAYDQRKEINY